MLQRDCITKEGFITYKNSNLQTLLANVEQQAQALFDRLMKQGVECGGINAKQIEEVTNL